MNSENLQTLAKIASNCVEISSALGVNLLLGVAVVAVNRYHRHTIELLCWGLASLLGGAILPGVIQHFLSSNEVAAAAIAIFAAFVLIGGVIWFFFLPMQIARYRNHAHLKAIIALNLLLLVPFAWHLALWWATVPHKREIANPADYYSAKVMAICQHADMTVHKLNTAGFKKAGKKVQFAARKDVSERELLVRLTHVLDRLMFDFQLPEALADEVRGLSAEIEAAQIV
jgi:hypothetical protein